MTKKDIQAGTELLQLHATKINEYEKLNRKMHATRAGKAVEAAAPELMALTQKVNAYMEACAAVGDARDKLIHFKSLMK